MVELDFDFFYTYTNELHLGPFGFLFFPRGHLVYNAVVLQNTPFKIFFGGLQRLYFLDSHLMRSSQKGRDTLNGAGFFVIKLREESPLQQAKTYGTLL